MSAHHRILEGSTFSHVVQAGAAVRMTDGVGPEIANTADAEGNVMFDGLTVGRWWLAVETMPGTWERAGVVDVLPLADQELIRMQREVDDLNDKLKDIVYALEFQTVDSEAGYTRMKAQHSQIVRQRNNAQARLDNYIRRSQGISPWRSVAS